MPERFLETASSMVEAPESKKERIPTREEVRALFREFAKGKSLEEVRLREDAKGLLLLEAEAAGPGSGEKTIFCFARKQELNNGNAALVSTIDVMYEEDGIPAGGKVLADFVDGVWVRK